MTFRLIFIVAVLVSSATGQVPWDGEIQVHGALRAMFHEGRTGAETTLADLPASPSLFAVGALADLSGEITIIDGRVHLSYPEDDGTARWETLDGSDAGAALLVAAEVDAWCAVRTSEPLSFADLDDGIAALAERAGLAPDGRFPFLMEGEFEDLHWHVIDGRRLVDGGSSHEDHLAAAVTGREDRVRATLIGFHSLTDQRVFTHHSSNTHIHFVDDESGFSGHVDHVVVPAGTIVKFPVTDTLLAGQTMAVAYSGFRAGQHPDRGDGAVNPTREQIHEDLEILVDAGFRLIRTYDAGENSRTVLELIREHDLPLEVLQGMWLSAEVSNHEGCSWLNEPIPEEELTANRINNAAEVERGIALANEFPEVVVAVNVGNEALVDWNDHMMTAEGVIAYVRRVKEAIHQEVTVAENYVWWAKEGAALAAELDFIGVHSYPVWEGRTIDEGLSYTLENIAMVRDALPDARIAVLEAGWATTAEEFGERAGEAQQKRYYEELAAWAEETGTTVFFFEAFDEPWKGDPARALGAEKHWGLWFEDRTAKGVMRDSLQAP